MISFKSIVQREGIHGSSEAARTGISCIVYLSNLFTAVISDLSDGLCGQGMVTLQKQEGSKLVQGVTACIFDVGECAFIFYFADVGSSKNIFDKSGRPFFPLRNVQNYLLFVLEQLLIVLTLSKL